MTRTVCRPSRRAFVSRTAPGLAATVLALPARSTPSPPTPPAPAALAADIDLAEAALRGLHPGLRRYLREPDLDAMFAGLREDFASAPSPEARFLVLARALARIRCGHTYPNFFNQRPEVARALFDRRTRLPFTFTWIDGSMVVTGTGPAPAVAGGPPPGSVVHRIDGEPVSALLRAIWPLVRADGHNDGKRLALLGVSGRRPLETFDVFHGLLRGVPAQAQRRVAWTPPGGSVREADLPAWTPAEREAAGRAGDTARRPGDVPWTWVVRPDGVAVLTMDGWALYDDRIDWRTWLDRHLDTLPGLRGLVVDLRRNEGGLDCGHPILARFLSAPSLAPQRRLVRYRRTPPALDRHLDTWDDGFRDWGEAARPLDDGWFELPAEDTRVLPHPRRATCPLVVLTSATNSSATFGFAQRVREARAGWLVGETTGGNLRGVNGGAFFFVRLPASGLEFDLPLIGFYPAIDREGTRTLPPDGGLVPDLVVAPTWDDVVAGRDRGLAQAVALALSVRA